MTDKEVFNNFSDEHSLFWLEEEIQYGDWAGGPNRDGAYEMTGSIEISEASH